MEIPKKIYFKLRPLILPINEIIKFIPHNAFILDIGCGKGILTNYIFDFNKYTGVDLAIPILSNNDNIEFIKSDCLSFISNDLSKFNTFLIIDLLHHIPKTKQEIFLNQIISNMKIGDRLIIKDIFPKNFITKFWNVLHDLLVAQQLISYFEFLKFEKNLNTDFKIISRFHKRIFLYDHYFLVIEKI